MGQLLFVVSRDALKRYEDLKRAFSDRAAVEVILDRRFGERRQLRRARPPVERRRSERRSRPDVDSELRSIGYSVVRITRGAAPGRSSQG